jgi:hypothetical protein
VFSELDFEMSEGLKIGVPSLCVDVGGVSAGGIGLFDDMCFDSKFQSPRVLVVIDSRGEDKLT